MPTDPNDPTTSEDEHQPAGVDRVMEVSKKPDGTPDQTAGFEVIDPEEDADTEADAETEKAPKARRQVDVETTTARASTRKA